MTASEIAKTYGVSNAQLNDGAKKGDAESEQANKGRGPIPMRLDEMPEFVAEVLH
jgi:hypothetical protein